MKKTRSVRASSGTASRLRAGKKPTEHTKFSGVLYGLHPVAEALSKGYAFKKLFVKKGLSSSKVEAIIGLCKAKKIPFHFVDGSECDNLSGGATHQGVVATLKKGSRFVGDLSSFLASQGGEHFIVAMDRLQDPHNLGAITRTAAFFGARLLVLERSNAAPINATVHKVSSGASLLVNFYQAQSLTKALEVAREHGYAILASSTEENASPVRGLSLPQKTCLVIGSESTGVRSSILSMAHQNIRIGSFPSPLNSLNASVAAGILMHELTQKP